jgi:plasmid maintenance system antidote protein VapI
MKKIKNVHPGEILKVDFLDEVNITPYALAKATGVNQTKISQHICRYCLRPGKFFNMPLNSG